MTLSSSDGADRSSAHDLSCTLPGPLLIIAVAPQGVPRRPHPAVPGDPVREWPSGNGQWPAGAEVMRTGEIIWLFADIK